MFVEPSQISSLIHRDRAVVGSRRGKGTLALLLREPCAIRLSEDIPADRAQPAPAGSVPVGVERIRCNIKGSVAQNGGEVMSYDKIMSIVVVAGALSLTPANTLADARPGGWHSSWHRSWHGGDWRHGTRRPVVGTVRPLGVPGPWYGPPWYGPPYGPYGVGNWCVGSLQWRNAFC
jgi:hypothetical protein